MTTFHQTSTWLMMSLFVALLVLELLMSLFVALLVLELLSTPSASVDMCEENNRPCTWTAQLSNPVD
jgi:hypothetical protein